ETLRQPPRGPDAPNRYCETAEGISMLCRTVEGQMEETPLTTFHARIRTEVTRDDGEEEATELEIEAWAGGKTACFTLSAREFQAMSWPIEYLGARAAVYPGQARKDHARFAIQRFSQPERRTVYTHTGWREVDGVWVFLHAGGALGEDGVVPGIAVELPR